MRQQKIIGLYLGAGKSSRMGKPKLSIPILVNYKLGELALLEARQSMLDHIIVVTSKDRAADWLPETEIEIEIETEPEIENEIENEIKIETEKITEGMTSCSRVQSEMSHLGMSYSIRAGLQAAMTMEADAIVILLADQPLIHAAMVDRLIHTYYEDEQLDYVASLDGNKAKPPILLARSMFQRVMMLEGDQGARELLSLPEVRGRLIEEANVNCFLDVDTEEDLLHIVDCMEAGVSKLAQ